MGCGGGCGGSNSKKKQAGRTQVASAQQIMGAGKALKQPTALSLIQEGQQTAVEIMKQVQNIQRQAAANTRNFVNQRNKVYR